MHRLLGNSICSFYSTEIDSLIDQASRHDSSRYDVSELERIIRVIRSRYGNKGVCYFILHHYLDRLVDILVSILSRYYESYALENAELSEVYRKLREEVYVRLYHDPKNILSLLVSDLQKLLSTLYLVYTSRNRSQNRYFEELLRKAYKEISKSKELQEIKDTVKFVLDTLYEALDCVLYSVLLDETFRSSTLNRVGNTLQVKIARYTHRGSTELAGNLLNKEKISMFLSHVLNEAYKKCQKLREKGNSSSSHQ